MIRTMRPGTIRACIAAMCLSACTVAKAISPEELQRELTEGKPPTIIDVRATGLYTQGHLPNAINIPASLCAQKALPRLGRVIVYGDGFGNAEKEAVEALNAKPGIQAELLEGGYSAWEAAQGATTMDRGLNPEKLQYVTYQQLQETTSEVLLVDLRKEPESQPESKGLSAAAVGASNKRSALTDLSKAFPGKPITKSPHRPTPQLGAKSANRNAGPIMVLIDNGDGTAQETARVLRAQGSTRFVILAGGETTVARQGERGLQRTGMNLENINKAITGGSN